MLTYCAGPASFGSFRAGRNSGKGSSLWYASRNCFGRGTWSLAIPAKPSSPEIPLPRGWPSRVKSAILHVISLGQFTLAYTRGWAATPSCSRSRPSRMCSVSAWRPPRGPHGPSWPSFPGWQVAWLTRTNEPRVLCEITGQLSVLTLRQSPLAKPTWPGRESRRLGSL